jgi:uncharacterized protein DUF4199
MDHPCYKCGHIVEDGKPFCAECGAPQIRVAVPEPAPAGPGSVLPVHQPIFTRDALQVPGALAASALSPEIVWPRALRVCAVAALISIVVTSLRLVPPLLAAPGAGTLAVILYRRRNQGWRVTAGSGARVGAVTGLLASAVFAFFSAIFVAVLQSGGQVRQEMIEALQQVASRSSDPQVQATLDLLVKPENLSKLILGIVLFIFFSIAAGSLAGALTGALLGRGNRP